MEKGKNADLTVYRERLDKQLENLEALNRKLQELDPENPSRDMVDALYLELGRAFEEIASLNRCLAEVEKGEESEQRQREIKELAEKKEHLLRLLKFRDYENEKLREDYTRLEGWIKRLQKDHRQLVNSSSWKLGKALVSLFNKLRLKRQKHDAAKQIDKIFEEFESFKVKSRPLPKAEVSSAETSGEVKQLSRWLEKLQQKMQLLRQSRRWKLAEVLGIFIPGGPAKGRIPAQLRRIEEIFSAYSQWTPQEPAKDLDQLKRWLEKFERNYRALMNSKRWKLADKIFSSVNAILSRSQEKLPTKEIEKILTEFKRWRQNR